MKNRLYLLGIQLLGIYLLIFLIKLTYSPLASWIAWLGWSLVFLLIALGNVLQFPWIYSFFEFADYWRSLDPKSLNYIILRVTFLNSYFLVIAPIIEAGFSKVWNEVKS